jgi:hypothetical protein
MININLLKQQLTPEQNKVLEEVFTEREDVLLGYKYLQKKYSGTKGNIKRIEKKLIVMMEQSSADAFTPKWIEGEIASIENKYPAIDKAIKNYRQSMQFFNRDINHPLFRTFNPHNMHDRIIQNLKSHLYSANQSIDGALDAIRITGRYFKNITTAFQSHAARQKIQKSRSHLLKSLFPAAQDIF